jgi:hypothetical protein
MEPALDSSGTADRRAGQPSGSDTSNPEADVLAHRTELPNLKECGQCDTHSDGQCEEHQVVV